MEEREVRVSVGAVELEGNLDIPEDAQGIVLFAHASGSGRHSPRNRYVAEVLRKAGLATLLVDLLTLEEEEVDLRTRTSASTSGCLPTGSRARPTGWRRTGTRKTSRSVTSAQARGRGPHWSRQPNNPRRWARLFHEADGRIYCWNAACSAAALPARRPKTEPAVRPLPPG
jgi:hypothetical protein